MNRTVKLAVIKDAGDSRTTKVLGGLYGHFDKDTGTFFPSNEVAKSSTLFGHIGSGLPIAQESLIELEIPGHIAIAVKGNLAKAVSENWALLYESVTPRNKSGLGAALLQRERELAVGTMGNYAKDLGLQVCEVEIKYNFKTQYQAANYIGSQGLTAQNDDELSLQFNWNSDGIDGRDIMFDIVDARELPEHEIVAHTAAQAGQSEAPSQSIRVTNADGLDMRQSTNSEAPSYDDLFTRRLEGTVTARIEILAGSSDHALDVATFLMSNPDLRKFAVKKSRIVAIDGLRFGEVIHHQEDHDSYNEADDFYDGDAGNGATNDDGHPNFDRPSA